MTTFASLKDLVQSLYIGYFGRTDGGAGTSYWVNQIESGAMTLAKVAESFAVQPETLAKYSLLSAPNTGNAADFVNQVYQQLFNHAADAAGLAYWTAQLAAAPGNPQAVGQFIANVISGATGSEDATLRTKVDISQVASPQTPDVLTHPTVPVAPPTEPAPTNDTLPPVNHDAPEPSTSGLTDYIAGGDTLVISSGALVLYDFYSGITDWVSLTGLNQALVSDHFI